jgi:hypothetical protein
VDLLAAGRSGNLNVSSIRTDSRHLSVRSRDRPDRSSLVPSCIRVGNACSSHCIQCCNMSSRGSPIVASFSDTGRRRSSPKSEGERGAETTPTAALPLLCHHLEEGTPLRTATHLAAGACSQTAGATELQIYVFHSGPSRPPWRATTSASTSRSLRVRRPTVPAPSSLRLTDYVAPTLCRLDLPVLLHRQAPHRGSDPAGQGRRTPPPRLSHPVRALPPRPNAARLAGGEQTRTVPEAVRRGRTRAEDGGADGPARIGV